MDTLCAVYRTLATRTGKAEPVLHLTFLIYAVLFFVSALLNLFSPAWVSRNALPFDISHLASTATSRLPFTSVATAFTSAHASSPSSPSSESSKADERAISRCVTRGLLLDLFDDPVVNRVRTEMECGCRSPTVYEAHESPTVCAIVQSFNHRNNVEKIAQRLVSNPSIDEIIVCEDGSTDGSLEKWTESLRGVKHFVILSNNLHEVRCYNRAMRLSSAKFFILMQDDDIPPESSEQTSDSIESNWVDHAVKLFKSDEKLGILSGFIGQLWDQEHGGLEFGEQTSDHGGQRKGKTYRIPFVNSHTRNPFMYCECAWAAPLFIRAHALRRVGGLDVGLFGVREPGVWQDCVLSYASWTAGWRAGVYDARFQRGVGGHGSTQSKTMTKMRDVVWRRAKTACDERYDREYIHSHVVMLNNHTLLRRFENFTY